MFPVGVEALAVPSGRLAEDAPLLRGPSSPPLQGAPPGVKKAWHYVERTDARGLVNNGCLSGVFLAKNCAHLFFSFRIVLVVGAKRGGLEVDVCRI